MRDEVGDRGHNVAVKQEALAPDDPAIAGCDLAAHAEDGHDPGRCGAFRAAMEILGRPWNGVLLRALGLGPARFSALAEHLGIGDRMLSCRLKDLEAAGLVVRTVDAGPPVRVSYALTPLGHGLDAVTASIEAWGADLVAARGAHPVQDENPES